MSFFITFVMLACFLHVAFSITAADGWKTLPKFSDVESIVHDNSHENKFNVLIGTSGNLRGNHKISTPPAFNIAPQFVWVDAAGVVYFSDPSSHLIRAVKKDNSLVTIGGTGVAGFNGDGNAGTNTSFSHPRGISGIGRILLVCDTGNFRIRTIGLSSSKTVMTIAGTGIQGYSKDGFQAIDAQLFSPYGIWADSSAELVDIYFTELHKCTIRKISGSEGSITTIAGVAGVCGNNGDGNYATATWLNLPSAIFANDVNPGVIYFAEFGSNLIRKLDVTNFPAVITRIAGIVDGEAGRKEINNAGLNEPSGIWVDQTGVVYFTERSTGMVRKISLTGKISTLAEGTGGRASSVWGDEKVTFKLYLPDSDNHRIVTMDLQRPTPTCPAAFTPKNDAAPVIETIIGNGGSPNPLLSGQISSKMPIGEVQDIWGDSNGNLYLLESNTNCIFKIDTNCIINLFAGGGSEDSQLDGTDALDMQFSSVPGIWGDDSGLYVIDNGLSIVMKIAWTEYNPVYHFAGGGTDESDGILATTALLLLPYDGWSDNRGTNYFIDRFSCVVYQVDSLGILKVIAGVKNNCRSSSAAEYTFANPKGIVGDNFGRIYISDEKSIAIYDTHTQRTSMFVGKESLSKYTSNGSMVMMHSPDSLWADSFGNVYFSDQKSYQIKVVITDGPTKTIHPIAGSGTPGACLGGGDPLLAHFRSPRSIWGDINNNLYVADSLTGRVLVIRNYRKVPHQRSLPSQATNSSSDTVKVNLRNVK